MLPSNPWKELQSPPIRRAPLPREKTNGSMTISSYEKLELQTHREALTISVSVLGGTVASLCPPKLSSTLYLDFVSTALLCSFLKLDFVKEVFIKKFFFKACLLEGLATGICGA